MPCPRALLLLPADLNRGPHNWESVVLSTESQQFLRLQRMNHKWIQLSLHTTQQFHPPPPSIPGGGGGGSKTFFLEDCLSSLPLEDSRVWITKCDCRRLQSLAPLSWFPGSRKPTAHVHQCCRFQSYAKSRRLHAIANEIYKRNLHCVNHIPGIHNGPPRTTLWRLTLTLTAYWACIPLNSSTPPPPAYWGGGGGSKVYFSAWAPFPWRIPE